MRYNWSKCVYQFKIYQIEEIERIHMLFLTEPQIGIFDLPWKMKFRFVYRILISISKLNYLVQFIYRIRDSLLLKTENDFVKYDRNTRVYCLLAHIYHISSTGTSDVASDKFHSDWTVIRTGSFATAIPLHPSQHRHQCHVFLFSQSQCLENENFMQLWKRKKQRVAVLNDVRLQ
jgi:hypothetical protein